MRPGASGGWRPSAPGARRVHGRGRGGSGPGGL